MFKNKNVNKKNSNKKKINIDKIRKIQKMSNLK